MDLVVQYPNKTPGLDVGCQFQSSRLSIFKLLEGIALRVLVIYRCALVLVSWFYDVESQDQQCTRRRLFLQCLLRVDIQS